MWSDILNRNRTGDFGHLSGMSVASDLLQA